MTEIFLAASLALLATLTAGLSTMLLPADSGLARDLGLPDRRARR